MRVYHWIILALWLVFIVVWAVSARGAKPSVGGRWALWRGIGIRLAIGVLVILVLRPAAHDLGFRIARQHLLNENPALGATGVVLCMLGIGLAVWARIHIGRNWGIPMSRKENPELVTSGPYASVRHPIYSGLLLAILGTAIGVSALWLIAFVIGAAYFGFAAWREERLLAAEFPKTYPAYRSRTKMFAPFLF